jgi:threonine-phosphate decarboxylase
LLVAAAQKGKAMTRVPRHGGQLHALAREFGLVPASLVDFSASISPYPLPEHVLERMARAAADPNVLRLYPDSENVELKNAVAVYLSVEREGVLVANGVMPLVTAALQALGARRCMVATPSFGGYDDALRIARAERVFFLLNPEQEFALHPTALIESAIAQQCDAILVANPHSPSGQTASRNTMQQLCEQASDANIAMLVDEAFIDFVPEDSVADLASFWRNCVVFRSPTKFLSIPALRVAYAVASPELVFRIEEYVHEWSVSTLAALACAALLDCREHHVMVRERTVEERLFVSEQLREAGIRVFPSRANFLFMRTDTAEQGRNLWRSLIANHGIVLRSCANFAGLDASYLRFGLRLREENEKLIEALTAIAV